MTAKNIDLCLALGNHWSYTGIGWQLGLESCAESIADSLTMADHDPAVKTGINLDALAYELVAEHYPELISRLKQYLDEGRVEIIGGTFGQPMGSMVSGESNLRHLVMGQQTIHAALGRHVAVFLEEEEMTFPQVPQLVTLTGYKYASLAQCDTWGRHGAPKIERNIICWEGVDGSRVTATPANAMVFHPPCVTHDIDWLWSDAGKQAIKSMKALGQPAFVLKWTEFGWESLGGKAINKFDPELFKTLSSKFAVEYVTIEEYLDRHGGNGARGEPVRLKMDDFAKLLPWGVGGDQVRRFGREVEAVLLAAERFDAAARALGCATGPRALEALHGAWRDLLVSQSHDVSLCEYSRWQSTSPPRDPILDAHYQTWGSIGYRYMDRAMEAAGSVLRQTIEAIASGVNTHQPGNNTAAAVVFNASGFAAENGVVTTGKIQLGGRSGGGVHGLRVRDSAGNETPWQLGDHTRDPAGKLVHAEIIFQATSLPAVGYDTFFLEPITGPLSQPVTDLRIDEANLRLENALVSVVIDPVCGAIRSLIDRGTGKEMIDGRRRPFPIFTGRPNGEALPKRHRGDDMPEAYDSSTTQAEFRWVERGPVRATLRMSQTMNRARLETYITLCAGSPAVCIHARLFPGLPPKTGEGNINGWQFPLEIEEGYWLEFAPGFTPAKVIRDYPFGVEMCAKNAIDALTFIDLVAADGSGLLVAHGGTQYFKRRGDGVIANLVVREWESHMTGEYGWPRVCEYHYSLTPHGGAFTNTDRLRAAAQIDHKPRCVTRPPGDGKLPLRQSFVDLDGTGAILSAFRRSSEETYEIRLVECEGKPTAVGFATSLPFTQTRPIDALGRPSAPPSPLDHPHRLDVRPWEIKTLELKP